MTQIIELDLAGSAQVVELFDAFDAFVGFEGVAEDEELHGTFNEEVAPRKSNNHSNSDIEN